jgi:hypothetical protein
MDTLLGLNIKAKWSKNVIGPFGFQFIGKDNDSGLIIPHISIPPPNVLVPIVIAFGGSKVMFGASTVKINVDGAGIPMGACVFPVVPLSLNQACNQPLNLPSDYVIAPNTVMVGLTLGDIVGGVVNIVLDMGLSFLLSKLGDKFSSGVTQPIVAAVLGKFGPSLIGGVAQGVINGLIDAALGFAANEGIDAGKGAAGKGAVGQAVSDPGYALGAWIDAPSSSSSSSTPAATSSGLMNNTPGAAPIHEAH